MFDKKKLKLGFKIIISFIMLLFLIKVTPASLSKYQNEANSVASAGVALYLLNADYYTASINLNSLEPKDEPYVYTFKIANFKDKERSDTDLTYDLSLVTTTNMPITLELYKNYDTNNSVITNAVTEKDADGTYFRKYQTATETFKYNLDQENIYTLYVYFPKEYNNPLYQDLIEYIKIEVDSKQILE